RKGVKWPCQCCLPRVPVSKSKDSHTGLEDAFLTKGNTPQMQFCSYEQICPGQVNPAFQAIHTFTYSNNRFIVYATGSKIVIYADPNRLVQIITASSVFNLQTPVMEPITAVSGSSFTGKIAISYKNQIAIMKPNQNDHWTVECAFETELETIHCLDWNELLSVGDMILLWSYQEESWDLTWKKKPADEVIYAKFEPNSSSFAAICKCDRMVTLWYKDGLDYSFTFLPHPAQVTHFAWRVSSCTKEDDCTLFTMARDGIGRFWSPVSLDKPHILYMCAVIDSNQSLVTSENDDLENKEDFSPIHYIGCDELLNAIHAQFKSHSRHDRFDQRLERIRDRVKDTPDLLFRIQADGSLTLWGVQHLNTWPRRIPRVFVVLRVARAIDPLHYIYFLNPTHILHDYSHIQSSSTIKPIELSLVAYNSHGQLRCYSLNLVDFLDSTSFSPKLHLKYSWLGHQHAISKLYQTHKNRFCTIGIDGQINVWKYELRDTCNRVTSELQMDCSLSVRSSNILAAPVGKEKYVAVYDGRQVQIYGFDLQDCHVHQSTKTCPVDGDLLPLSDLFVYNIEDEATTEIKSHILIGISATENVIYSWELILRQDDFDIKSRGKQEMNWEEPPVKAVSASQWATNTASKLFHRLTFDKRVAMALCVGSTIIFYNMHLPSNDGIIEWNTLYSIQVSSSLLPIHHIKFCSPNTLAVVSGNDSTQLSIWSEIRVGVAPVCERTLHFKQTIKDIAWNVTSDAQFILAIAFTDCVAIYGQKRATGVRSEVEWVCYTKFKVDTSEDITALAWVDYGVLTVATGNQLRCYLKWLTEQDTVNRIKEPINNKIEPMSSIYDISYEMNGPLPFYHPRHLIHYIMWGKMELVHNVLLTLYNFLNQFIDEEDNVITELPPVSFSRMLKLQNFNSAKEKLKGYDSLFDDSDTIQGSIDEDDDEEIRTMTANEAKNLAYSLKSKNLPGLTQSDKYQLIAMVNAIVEISSQGESMDENGARFTALIENHFHLNKQLPEEQRQYELQARDFIWALHSQSQDSLLDKCLQLCGKKYVWEDARSLGIFLWLEKIDTVREQMTAIARNTYLSNEDFRDPVDCTLFYFALRKKNLVQSLWRTASYHREQAATLRFLANDFSQPRWQTAASKNAFALLGKQRFRYAAAFFLLADKLRDAVNVILKNIKDYQLAIAICRVYEGDHSPLLREILENTVIPLAIKTNDRWLLSMAYWLFDKQKEATRAMIVPLNQFTDQSVEHEDSAAVVHDPNSFILYNYLKKGQNQDLSVPYDLEYNFSLHVAKAYERLGCPLLALHILTKYHMSPPSSSSQPDEAKDEVSRAADLFSNEITTNVPSRAEDLFAQDDLFASSNAKPAYAANLFDDDDELTTAKPSSKSLFDEEDNDLFASTSTNNKLFNSDQDIFAQETQSPSDDPEPLIDDVEDGLCAYKAMLVIRLLQTFFHAASAIYNGYQEPDNIHEMKYRSRFLQNRNAILELGQSVKIPPHISSRLLMEKSIEADVFPLYLYILNEGVPENFDVHQFLRAFKVGCFEVNEVALMPQDLDYATLVFVEHWTEHVIKTFYIWSQLRSHYCNPETATLTTKQIALTTYISAILVTLKERQYEKCWRLLYHLKHFLDSVGTETNSETAISTCFSQLLNSDTKMIEMVPEDFDSFSDGSSMFGFDMLEEVYRPLIDSQDNSVAANLLEVASLNYVLSSVEHAMQCQGRHHNLGELLSDFTWTTILDPIAYRAHCLKNTITEQLEGNLNKHNVLKQFKTLRQRKYWHSIKSLSSPDRLLPFINSLANDQHLQFCHVYHSPSTAYAFSIDSSTGNTLAICLKSEIQEIDLLKAPHTGIQSLLKARSVSSSGLAHEQHSDSYPDTEEDYAEDSSDNETEVASNMATPKSIRRKISRTSTAATPTAMSPAGSRPLEEYAQKASQNINLEYVYDSLRKSLAKGESSTARTSNAGSPLLMDNAERERMITFRRNVSATCAEAHPQYPFYITGCEINNGSPAAFLWQFGQGREIASYYGCQGKVTRIHFDHFGQKFGAGDTYGLLIAILKQPETLRSLTQVVLSPQLELP
ncbi:regulator of (H+)-ATPase in vacuolar membrane, partial [Rhizopus azygosporus]